MQALKRIRRREYLVNRRLQLTVMLQLTAIMAGMGLLYPVAMSMLPAEELTAGEMRWFITRATAIYFGLATALLMTLAIIVTHRIAGPAYVIQNAVKAMRKGDYGPRLTLRKRDYLKDVAAEVAGLRGEMMERDQMVRDLHACLDEGNLEGARELFVQLGVREEAPAVREEVGAES